VTGALRWMRSRVRRLDLARRFVPMRRTMARLRRSDIWRANTAFVGDREPVEVWRYGTWRMVRFRGVREGRPTDLVFAVPFGRRRRRVHAVFTDAQTGHVLAAFGGVSPRRAARRGRRAVIAGEVNTVRVLSDGD
jgi:hypothetical protein